MSGGLLPRRVVLSRPAVEELARRAGTSLPWPGGPPVEAAATDAELVGEHLVDADGRPVPDVRAGLEVLHATAALVDLDLAVGSRSSSVHLRSWQRWRAGCVAAVSTAGGRVELAWLDDRLWRAELARAIDVPTPPETGPAPDEELRVPHAVLVAAGEAVRTDRPALLAELATRAGAPAEQLRRLHASATARLQVVVAAGPGHRRTVGVLSWLRYADGWRALAPYLDRGEPMVHVHRVERDRLGIEVAALVAGVRS